MSNVKICYTASSGGHTQEMLQLNNLMKKYPGIIITESKSIKEGFEKIYYIEQVNRKSLKSILKFVFSFFSIRKILKKEKPTHIISTGAMCTVPVCLIGKLMKIKIIYIESFARVDDLSMTGKMMYKFADLFIVQWEKLAARYDKAVYGGALF